MPFAPPRPSLGGPLSRALALTAALAAPLLGALALPNGAAWAAPAEGAAAEAERTAAWRSDARRLFHEHFAQPADLGEGWLLPWQAPRGVLIPRSPNGLSYGRPPRSEDAYWKKLEVEDAWSRWFRLDEDELRAELRRGLEMARAEMAKGQTLPPSLQPYASPSGLLGLFILGIRPLNLRASVSALELGVRLQKDGLAVLRAQFAPEEERAELLAEQERRMPEVVGADFRALDVDTALERAVAEARLVRRVSRMTYIHAASMLGASPAPDATYGAFDVTLYIVAREAIGSVLEDTTADEVAPLRRSIQEQLGLISKTLLEVAEARANQERAKIESARLSPEARAEQLARLEEGLRAARNTPRPTVRLDKLAFGEDSWIGSIEGSLPDGRSAQQWHARLRNGNAVVVIQGRGTLPADAMRTQLQYVLEAMDEATSEYTSDE